MMTVTAKHLSLSLSLSLSFSLSLSLSLALSLSCAQSEQLQRSWISRGCSLYLGTLGGEKGMRETRVE
jgi:hypothetical protein